MSDEINAEPEQKVESPPPADEPPLPSEPPAEIPAEDPAAATAMYPPSFCCRCCEKLQQKSQEPRTVIL